MKRSSGSPEGARMRGKAETLKERGGSFSAEVEDVTSVASWCSPTPSSASPALLRSPSELLNSSPGSDSAFTASALPPPDLHASLKPIKLCRSFSLTTSTFSFGCEGRLSAACTAKTETAMSAAKASNKVALLLCRFACGGMTRWSRIPGEKERSYGEGEGGRDREDGEGGGSSWPERDTRKGSVSL